VVTSSATALPRKEGDSHLNAAWTSGGLMGVLTAPGQMTSSRTVVRAADVEVAVGVRCAERSEGSRAPRVVDIGTDNGDA